MQIPQEREFSICYIDSLSEFSCLQTFSPLSKASVWSRKFGCGSRHRARSSHGLFCTHFHCSTQQRNDRIFRHFISISATWPTKLHCRAGNQRPSSSTKPAPGRVNISMRRNSTVIVGRCSSWLRTRVGPRRRPATPILSAKRQNPARGNLVQRNRRKSQNPPGKERRRNRPPNGRNPSSRTTGALPGRYSASSSFSRGTSANDS